MGDGRVESALGDTELVNAVIEHRRQFIGLKGFDYESMSLRTMSIVPPESVLALWREDYEKMRRDMIYQQAPDFDVLMVEIKALNEKINK